MLPSGLRVILVTLLCLQAMPQNHNLSCIATQFSPEYYSLLWQGKGKMVWWSVCINPNNHSQSQLTPQVITPLRCAQKNDSKKHEVRADSKEGLKSFQTELSWIQVLDTLLDVSLHLIADLWKLCLSFLNFEEEEAVPVVYDENFASINSGALLLAKSSSLIKGQKAILDDNIDKYLYTDDPMPLELVIALKEQVKIERIRILSSEIYSSITKDFAVYGALDIGAQLVNKQEDQWFKLLEAQAKNNGQSQDFRTKNKVVKFLKVRILSKHGAWKHFTLTQIKVFGKGILTEAVAGYHNTTSSLSFNDETDNVDTPELLDSLKEMYQLSKLNSRKKMNQNLLSFLHEQVYKLSKVEEFQIFYMQNLTKEVHDLQKKLAEDYFAARNDEIFKKQEEEGNEDAWNLQMSMIPTIMQVFREQQREVNSTLENGPLMIPNETVTIQEFISDQVQMSVWFVIGVAVASSIITSAILAAIFWIIFWRVKSNPRQVDGSPMARQRQASPSKTATSFCSPSKAANSFCSPTIRRFQKNQSL